MICGTSTSKRESARTEPPRDSFSPERSKSCSITVRLPRRQHARASCARQEHSGGRKALTMKSAQHRLLHQIGRWTRRTFGCHLQYDGKNYHQRCPVAMVHIQAGYSIGQTGLLECSICGEDLSECPHVRSRSYWVRGGAAAGRECCVCLREECNHRADRLYRARVIGIAKPTRVHEVSLVDRPANPECHLRGIEIPPRFFAEELGLTFLPGMTVSCDQCLNECPGFTSLRCTDTPEPISVGDYT